MITFALGVVVLAGCSATASETDMRVVFAALTASPTPNGGVLACSAMHRDLDGESGQLGHPSFQRQ